MIINIQNKNGEEFTTCISSFNNITPFNKAQTSLIVRIKELYLPEDTSHLVQNDDEIDFTGAVE